MGQDMELEFEKYCKVGGSPKTVLPPPQHPSKVEKSSSKGKPNCTNGLLTLEENIKEINFRRYRSSSCKNTPSRTSGVERKEVLKRGSVYQSSREVRMMNKGEDVECRTKIELSGSHAINFPSSIFDSLCAINEDNVVSSDVLLETGWDLNSREQISAENVDREKIEDPKFRCDPVVGPTNDGNGLEERQGSLTFHKSLSSKLAPPHPPSPSEGDSSKSRFSPFRKMFDPFTKSKSQRSPLGSTGGSIGLPPARPPSIKRSQTLQKSLLNDFSNVSQSVELSPQSVKKDVSNSAVSCSPAHLHGYLKLENKQGVPFFEFTSKFPEDIFVTRRWKAENALNWVYTFHNLHNRRKSNASGWGLKDLNKESSIMGQMQVSCYLCTELRDAGDFDNYMVTEFVLYDVARARQSDAVQGNLNQSPDVAKPPKVSNPSSFSGTRELEDVADESKLNLQQKHATKSTHFDSSTPRPWVPTDLHPGLEIAAIVIQVPFGKRESLKYKGGDAMSDQLHRNLLDLSSHKRKKEGIPDCSRPTKVNVVTTSGNHSLGSNDSCGPSPLLDRFRLGGGCECGGWDMGCPLTVFGNPGIQNAENQEPLELFIQGAKEYTPALTMKVIEEGRYSVDFHAKLSSLQAFSICVAMLHCTEASSAVRWERDKQSLQCNPLRVFIEEEVKNIIEAIAKEEERKVVKKMEEIPPSFKPNPPFSPIARV
ncbi:uncharacterized protein LOC131315645 [Rhododendron vialii]|uniref:uncharacterized protein LOC131315645 n=1 Tax=Rhododendron vialii TaxID=182163 RepID=UPI00265DB361|nr:uncharacterized protein LOC131315645 [Rhododendron vialii]XP_058200807.1 uncharacterized protein LOC131315645 [Rhododendron vialii]